GRARPRTCEFRRNGTLHETRRKGRRYPRCRASLPSSSGLFWNEGAWRDEPRFDIGEIEGVELDPQHFALEAQGVEDERLLLRRVGMLPDIAEREGDIGRRLGQPRREI